jgi:hypothetical protein
MKFVIRSLGVVALLSLCLWAYFGIPLWAPTEGADGRSFIIALTHFVAIVGAALSFFPDDVPGL